MRQETQWTTIFWEGWTALPEEELMAKPGRIHIVTEEVFL